MLVLRYILLLFITYSLLLVSPIKSSAQSVSPEPAEQFNAAGILYRDGDFQHSLDIYESLIQSGINNPDLLYNASNAAYRCGELGKAILYIERALALAPSDEDALANLAFLNSIKKDQEPVSDNVIAAFIGRMYDSINVNTAFLWSGILFAAAFSGAAFTLFSSGFKRMLTIGICSAFFIVSLFAGGISIHKLHKKASQAEAIIMSEEAKAFSGPDAQNTHIFTIHEGTKVIIERRQDDWSLIRLRSGAGGWIPSANMSEI